MEAYIQNASRQTGYRQKRRHKGRDIRAQLSMWSRPDTKRYAGVLKYVYADNVQADKRHE
jgi:hypothetical protein